MNQTLDELNLIRSEVKRPSDFDTFWQEVENDVRHIPLDWERESMPQFTTSHLTVDRLSFPTLDGEFAYAWLAVPKGAEAYGNIGYLWLPGYSLGNPSPSVDCVYPRTVTMGLNVHGLPADTPYRHPRTHGADYITCGIESPRTYIFRKIIANCLRAAEVLGAQPEVDARCLVVGGMSQGGGLALIVAALLRHVRLCFADMPWLCDLDRALSLIDRERYRNVPGAAIPDSRIQIEDYADKHPAERDQIFKTYRYFDPLSHAGNIRCPVQMSAGGRDPSCRPPTIYSVYREVPGEKEMLYLPETGHEIVSSMHDAHLNWLERKLK